MDLLFKKPQEETKRIMSRVAIGKTPLEEKDMSFTEIAQYNLQKTLNHEYVHLVNSGNGAIFTALASITGEVLLPDQGGWHGFKQISRFLNRPFKTIKTDTGLINFDELNNTLESLDKSKRNGLILTSYAGYTAEQNIKEISKICHDNGVILIEDVSGSISDPEGKLANGKYSDIIVGSTGSPKILNVEDGGFISSNDSSVFEDNRILLKSFKSNEITASGIVTELSYAKDNLSKTIKACNYLKNMLDNVIYPDKRGVNLIIKSDNPKELSWNLKSEFNLDEHGMITRCPNYNRVKEKAVAVEIKNLDISELYKENLDEIIEIIKKYQ
jgi:hypothetical protein